MEYIEKELGWDVTRTIYEQELNTKRQSFFLVENQPLYHILRGIFEEGQKNGEFRKDLTKERMVLMLSRVIRGFLYDWSIKKGSFSLVDEHIELFDIVIEGLMKR